MRPDAWSPLEKSLLLLLRDKRRMKWADVSKLIPGRSPAACTVAYFAIKHKVRLEKERAEARNKEPRPSRAVSPAPVAARPQQAPPSKPSPRATSTFILREDAELRARIETLGITAGLLGDPAPGRSALDAKLAGEVPAGRITLATGRP